MADDGQSSRAARKTADLGRILVKEEIRARSKQISEILKTDNEERTSEQKDILEQSPDIVEQIQKRAKERDNAKQRQLEIEDPMDVLDEKCKDLAEALKNSRNTVIYTGAGISTAASIPDYRGPNGIWTLLQQGKSPDHQDLSDATPTYTHMCILKLLESQVANYVVSQNCDGLHLRSGVPRDKLSELHGNMYIEVCRQCKPTREYTRLFDVTEKTGVRKHVTGRKCHHCNGDLEDTIVHFGEKGDHGTPHNWEEAAESAKKCEVILCIGTSLKVLKKYPCLWNMDKPVKKRPKLFIINLQWTPKDDVAWLKINGKCDDVMRKVMCNLNLEASKYKKEEDPIFKVCSMLKPEEENTTSKKLLEIPVAKTEDSRYKSIRNLLGLEGEQTPDKHKSEQSSVSSESGKGLNFNLCDLINFAIIKTFKNEVDKEDMIKPKTSDKNGSLLAAISRCEEEEARLLKDKRILSNVDDRVDIKRDSIPSYPPHTSTGMSMPPYVNKMPFTHIPSFMPQSVIQPQVPRLSLPSTHTSASAMNSLIYSEHLRNIQRIGVNMSSAGTSTPPTASFPVQDEPLNLSCKPTQIMHVDKHNISPGFSTNGYNSAPVPNGHDLCGSLPNASSRSDRDMAQGGAVHAHSGDMKTTPPPPVLTKDLLSSEASDGKRPASLPGWYGKGFNPKRHKRKKSFT